LEEMIERKGGFPLKPEGGRQMALSYMTAGALMGASERHNSRQARTEQLIPTEVTED